MVEFEDLPLEILPEIFEHVGLASHLRSLCLVNSTWKKFAISRLYSEIRMYAWYRDGKSRIVQLFTTLAHSPSLASLVNLLDIRDFPKSLPASQLDMISIAKTALENCTNLKTCSWTRDGALSTEILQALAQSRVLQELQINGHNEGHYDPRVLLQFLRLSRICIIMPSASVISQLRPWLGMTGPSLRSLTLICKATSLVNDGVLQSLAPSLVDLDHLHLAGCPKVTHEGVWPIVSTNKHGLLSLGLEGVSSKFNMELFAQQCSSSGALVRLRSITLTIDQQVIFKTWAQAVIQLLQSSPLKFFHLYSTGTVFESSMTDELWEQLIATHGARLVRFSVHRMLISLDAILEICIRCTQLEQLFVVVERDSLDMLGRCLSCATKLRTVHVNFPVEAASESIPILHPSQATHLVNQCPSTLTQFGCNTRVWHVGRECKYDANGSFTVTRTINRYDSPDVPEQFQVVRT